MKFDSKIKQFIIKKSKDEWVDTCLDYRACKRRSKFIINNKRSRRCLDVSTRHGCCLIVSVDDKDKYYWHLNDVKNQTEKVTHATLIGKIDESMPQNVYRRNDLRIDNAISYGHLFVRKEDKNGFIYMVMVIDTYYEQDHTFDEIKKCLRKWLYNDILPYEQKIVYDIFGYNNKTNKLKYEGRVR